MYSAAGGLLVTDDSASDADDTESDEPLTAAFRGTTDKDSTHQVTPLDHPPYSPLMACSHS